MKRLMSLKKVIMIGLVCAVLVSLGAVAYAGWGGCCGFFYYGSIETELTVQGGSSGDAFVLWMITPKEVEVLCANPAYNDASLTVVLRQVPISTMEEIPQDDQGTGRNGKLTVSGSVDTAGLVDDGDCINPNWHALNGEDLNNDGEPDEPDTVVVRVFDATAEIKVLDPKKGTTTEFRATYTDCILDSMYGADNLPPDDEQVMYTCASETTERKP
jgi:hypothetical protein